MTFDEFKKKYAKLNALLDAADEVLTDLYQELPITEGRRGKNLIKTGNKFSAASGMDLRVRKLAMNVRLLTMSLERISNSMLMITLANFMNNEILR